MVKRTDQNQEPPQPAPPPSDDDEAFEGLSLEELGQAYAAAMDLMRQWDEGLPAEEQGGAAALKEAQRAWITFRDKACAAEGYAMKGGSAEPLLVYGCMARVTEERASHLWAMVQAYGDL